MIDFIHRSIEMLSFIISMVGIVIVLWGTIGAIVSFFRIKLHLTGGDSLSRDVGIRQELGAHLLLGLEIFIAADIISSVASPSWEKVGILGAIVGIRTVLSYFLEKEMTMERATGIIDD
ncbi:MAG: DUF1622 domain-containing protein [bacterium]|nr:MAG: DUF1622 domain-containing protein [bacterium]